MIERIKAGDVMRELDRQGVIESDPFILISGDVVSNVDLSPFIAAHKARRKQRAENIMTMLFRRVVRSFIGPSTHPSIHPSIPTTAAPK